MIIKDVLEIVAIFLGFLGSLFIFFKWILPKIKRVFWFTMAANSLYDNFGVDAGVKIKNVLVDLQSSTSLMQVKQDLLSKHLDLGIFVADSSGNFVAVNPVLSELFGIDEKDFHGSGWLQGIKDRIAAFERWKICRSNDIPYNDNYIVINKRTQQEIPIYTEAFPVKTPDNILLCYVGFVKKRPMKV